MVIISCFYPLVPGGLQYSSRGNEAERLEKDLREAQTLQHHTFSQVRRVVGWGRPVTRLDKETHHKYHQVWEDQCRCTHESSNNMRQYSKL